MAEVLLDADGPVAGRLEIEQVDRVAHDGGAAVPVAGRVHGLREPLGIVVRSDDGRARVGEPGQRRAPGGSTRSGDRDHRAAERSVAVSVCHRLRLLNIPGTSAHAAARSALVAVMPLVEAITFFSFLESAS